MRLATSGGKPTFLTLRLSIMIGQIVMNAFPAWIKTQLKSAQGKEGGLAPAGSLSSPVFQVIYPAETLAFRESRR
jgi:hypothetical protein